MTNLDDRILGVVIEDEKPRPDAELHIEYTTRVKDKVIFFELSPLVAAVRTLLTTARPLRQSDLVPAAGSAAVNLPPTMLWSCRRNVRSPCWRPSRT